MLFSSAFIPSQACLPPSLPSHQTRAHSFRPFLSPATRPYHHHHRHHHHYHHNHHPIITPCKSSNFKPTFIMVTTSSSSDTSTAHLQDLPLCPFLNDQGLIHFTPIQDSSSKAVGVYAIYDQEQTLQFIGISRDVVNTFKMLMVRKPRLCYYYRVKQVQKPSRVVLENMKEAWLKEYRQTPPGMINPEQLDQWESPVNVRHLPDLTEEERELISTMDFDTEKKVLKNIARRVQENIEKIWKERNYKENVRFAPKLKDKGLLDIESVKIDVPDQI